MTDPTSFRGAITAIVDGKITAPLVITLHEYNFIGTVEKSGEIIKFGSITLKNKGNMEVLYVKINFGQFADYLADGEYMIKNVSSTTSTNHHDQIHFEMKDGQISISTAIKLKDNNVTGTVLKNNSVINGTIRIRQENGDLFDSFVISQGKFSTYLPDGTFLKS